MREGLRRRCGFTLVELLVVMGIIAVLGAMLMPVIFSAITKVREGTTRMEINSLSIAMTAYQTAFGEYPPDNVANEPFRIHNGTVVQDVTKTLNSAEALVFYLGTTFRTEPQKEGEVEATKNVEACYDFDAKRLWNPGGATYGSLTYDDEVLLLGLGGQIASAIQSTRLLAETQRRAQEATALYRTAEAIGRVGDLEGTFQSLAEALVEVLGYSSSWIAVVNEAGDAIQGVAGYGYGMTEQTVKGSEPLHEGYMNPTVLAVLQRQAIVVNDPATDERAADIPAEVRALASKLAEVPIMIGDEAVGILAVSRLADQPDITERDVEVLQAVANQAAVAMENARLLAETHTSLERLQQAYEAQAHLAQTVRELSTPIVPVTREVLVLPLVGALDAQRAEQVIASLLKSIEEQRARVVIMDITGVPVVDTHVANYLLRAALAARLLGAEVILVGITPQVAQAVVGLGVDLSEIVTRSDLQSGIEYALGLVGMTIVEKH